MERDGGVGGLRGDGGIGGGGGEGQGIMMSDIGEKVSWWVVFLGGGISWVFVLRRGISWVFVLRRGISWLFVGKFLGRR